MEKNKDALWGQHTINQPGWEMQAVGDCWDEVKGFLGCTHSCQGAHLQPSRDFLHVTAKL